MRIPRRGIDPIRRWQPAPLGSGRTQLLQVVIRVARESLTTLNPSLSQGAPKGKFKSRRCAGNSFYGLPRALPPVTVPPDHRLNITRQSMSFTVAQIAEELR